MAKMQQQQARENKNEKQIRKTIHPHLPQRVDAVPRYAVTAGHEYADGRVLVRPDLFRRRQWFPVRRITVGLVVRHHSLTVTRVHRVTESQEHVHSGRRDFVTVSIAVEWPFNRETA